MSYFEIFKREIIKHSMSQDYYEACSEWEEMSIAYADDDEDYECICSHPIKQLITIRNRENNNEVIVGSDCICKIHNFPHASLYQPVITNLVELKRNPDDATIGKRLIEYIRIRGVLEDRHIAFLEQMRCKRYLSEKQENYYNGLKKKILRLLEK
jgi:hypothetical protein